MKAYPFSHRHPTTGVTTSSEGMDLRDYFAGQVLKTFCQNKNLTIEEIVVFSYKMADTMMLARETKDEQS
jgi:hypothetical protein